MKEHPPEVWILPMDSQKEFGRWSVERVQQEFFLNRLPVEKNGRYLYYTKDLRNAEPGSIVLFQYGGKLIALAIFIESIPLYDGQRGDYGGAIHFDPNSIRVFSPITAEKVRAVWPKFKNFGQQKCRLNPPQHYSKFEQRLVGVKKPQRIHQPTLAGVYCPPRLKCLFPVLQKWIELNNDLAEHWLIKWDGDVPWWYNERALLGLFSSSIWLSHGRALEEYSDTKRAVSRRGRFTGDDFTGRADLFFETPTGPAFRAEAKRCWLPTSQMKNQKTRLRKCLKQVCKDIHQASRGEQTQRIAIMFAIPYVSFNKTPRFKKHVKWAIGQVKSMEHDALAWTFPKIGTYGWGSKSLCPGIAMLIKEVR